MARVIVTGASGFLGKAIKKYFVSKGHDVIGWDITSAQDNVDVVDMRDSLQIKTHLIDVRPNIIIHCAGLADVGRSISEPLMDYESNVTITYNLISSIEKLHLENVRVVFLSSAAVYGNPETLPIEETTELSPISPYALHKIMCEDICKYYMKNSNMDIKIARIFSAYGPGLKKQIFWDMCKKWKWDKKLQMFGTGNESRDYIFSDDVAQAIYLIGTKETEDKIFNVANGEETSIRDVANLFANAAGIDGQLISFNGIQREGNPLNWRASINKLNQLGYKKSVNMNDGIVSYWEWVKTLDEY